MTKFNRISPDAYEAFTDVVCRDLVTVTRGAADVKHMELRSSAVLAHRLGFTGLPMACLVSGQPRNIKGADIVLLTHAFRLASPHRGVNGGTRTRGQSVQQAIETVRMLATRELSWPWPVILVAVYLGYRRHARLVACAFGVCV